MSAFKFFLSYPIGNGNYSEFEEITKDVLENSVGTLNQKLSSNEYDIGTVKFNKISVNLRNEEAKYSEANNPLSLFKEKRDESILKITWNRNVNAAYCGSTLCGLTYLTQDFEVYKGLLEDNSSKFDADQQVQSFNFLGLESIIGKTQVNFTALDVADDIETTIYNMLNQASITKFLTVDQSNISVNYNFTPDDLDPIKNKTVLEALDEILLLAGAVLYVQEDTIYVQTREASATSEFTFYGPSSDEGIENIIDISSYTLGLNRTFNFWSWRGTDITQSFVDSIEFFGYRPKEVDSEIITDPVKRTAVLNFLLNEFGFPKIELDLTVPMNTEIVEEVFLLDRINIDYPADYRLNEDGSIPARYGSAIYGQSTYINAISSLVINKAVDWKILNRSLSVRGSTINFRIREV